MREEKAKILVGMTIFSIVSLLTGIQAVTYFIMSIFIKEIFILLLGLLYLIISGVAVFTVNKFNNKLGDDINANIR